MRLLLHFENIYKLPEIESIGLAWRVAAFCQILNLLTVIHRVDIANSHFQDLHMDLTISTPLDTNFLPSDSGPK